MRSAFDELKELIDYIQSVYSMVTDEWLQNTKEKINLKKTQICDIDADGTIYQSIMEYVQLLNEKSADITLRLSSVCSCQVTARVKTQNSIEYKIQNYKTTGTNSERFLSISASTICLALELYWIPR